MKSFRFTLINLVVAALLVAGVWFMFRTPHIPADTIFATFLVAFAGILSVSDIILRVILPQTSTKKLWLIQLLFLFVIAIIMLIIKSV